MMLQRFFDILISFVVILALSPLLLPVVVILKFTGEGEVFYFQERVGFNGQVFRLIKFATMLKNSPLIGSGTITTKDDPRVLPVGKVLRKTKINELPQILNVLLGDMSFIGPRPLTSNMFFVYTQDVRDHLIKVKPGLSGVGSIIFRDEENLYPTSSPPEEFYKDFIAPYKGQSEKWYVKNRNIFTYFSLIFITIWQILFPKSRLLWTVYSTLPKPKGLLKQRLWN